MNYISPIKLLEEELPVETKEITHRDLSLMRRKLLAEAELSENKTVLREGVEFSKDEIVKLFDELEKNMRLDYHLRIFNNKPLLAFLETGVYDFTAEPIDTTAIHADPEFRDFVQPWFITVWLEAMLSEFRYKQYYNLVVLMDLGNEVIDQFLLPEILHPLEAKLWDFENAAKELSERILASKSADVDELDTYIYSELIVFLNRLPYTFGGLRNSYMLAMVNITVQLFNSGHRSLAINYGNTAVELDCDAFFKDQMTDRLGLYKKRKAPSTSSGNNSFRYWWLIVIAISTFSRLSTCNDSSDNYSNFKPSYGLGQSTPTGVPTLLERNSEEFYLYRNDIYDVDSSRITSVVLDRGNAVFLLKFLRLLQQNTTDLKIKNYPNRSDTNYDMDLSMLNELIDSNWKKDFESSNVSKQNARALIYNNTNTPMIFLYKYSNHLTALSIVPGAYREIEFEPGVAMMAPFFGVGWNKNKLVHAKINGKESLFNKGWFINKPAYNNNADRSVTLLNVQDKEPYADTIRFHYNLALGYSASIVGFNIKKAKLPSL